jgi:hypothetical protein
MDAYSVRRRFSQGPEPSTAFAKLHRRALKAGEPTRRSDTSTQGIYRAAREFGGVVQPFC